MDLKIFFFLGLLFGYLVGAFLVPKIINFIRNKIQDKTQTEYSNESHLGWDLPQIHHNEIFYVDVKTGKYHDIDELIMTYGRHGLCKLLAEGSLVNESIYEKRKICKWDDTEWHEPTVDYFGIEDKEEGTDV